MLECSHQEKLQKIKSAKKIKKAFPLGVQPRADSLHFVFTSLTVKIKNSFNKKYYKFYIYSLLIHYNLKLDYKKNSKIIIDSFSDNKFKLVSEKHVVRATIF